MTRVIIYGTLCILAALIVIDTNKGIPVDSRERALVREAVAYLDQRHLYSDAKLVSSIADSNDYRHSRVFSYLVKRFSRSDVDFSFYAYTPILSRSRVFLGESFYSLGVVGRSSILIHECGHIRWHRSRFLRGFPRQLDECQAYRRQYSTSKALGLAPDGEDGVVYWDMMIGMRSYVLPRYPAYAERPDIKSALKDIQARASAVPRR